MRISASFLFLPALLLTSVPQFAQSNASTIPASPFEGPAFSMSATDFQKAASAIPADKSSDATILYEEADYLFSGDGMLKYSFRIVYRVETQNGVRGSAEAAEAWDPWYQNRAEIQARVLQPDGAFAVLDPKTITDTPVASDKADTYTLAHVRRAPLPGVGVGSVVEEVLSVSEKRPYFSGGTTHRFPLANGVSTVYEKVVVELPSSTPFHDDVVNAPNLQVTRTNAGGVRRIVYRNTHEVAYPAADIALESSSEPTPFVEFSTASSWAAVAKGYAALADPSIQPDQVRALLPVSAGKDRLMTIQTLVERLHKEVRYTGVEFNQAEIVPEKPSEVLQRHYGDCKDKANLLVSMLRAEKIPAYLALLSVGNGRDVNPDLPGMNRFNHAIVYVPAAGKDLALWIDATAEYYGVGTLPFADAGRYALIIAPGTQGLIQTPEPKPEDSRVIETRTFTLADLGPAQVVESSNSYGVIDALYRSFYGGTITQKAHDDLESYGKRIYLAKALSKISHGDSADLSKPFDLTLTFDEARRGYTSLEDAAVTIFPNAAVNQLPSWFSTQPMTLPDNATAEQKQEQARKEAQRSPTYNIRPFITEQRYRIVAPAGFVLRDLPPDKTTPLGPATLTEHYLRESANILLADFRFTTGKSTITAQEALDMRKAVVELNKRNAVVIDFQQAGVKLQAEGKFKEAIAADKEAIAEEPKSALAHVRLARLLLDLGVGDLAHQEAEEAVAIDPKSVVALNTLGWVLEFDSMGTRFGEGFDRAGAIAAYKRALPLRTDDFDPRFDLAVLDEFDANGVRYAPDANLADAIALYRSLIADDTKSNSSQLNQHRINLGFALLYHGDYDELEKLLPEMAAGTERSVLTIANAAAKKDAKAGIAAADQLNLSTDDRNKALTIAGNDLAQMGMYQAAADLLSAGLQRDGDATATARKIEIFRKLHRVPRESPPVTSPESAVFADMNMQYNGDGTPEKIRALFSPHSFSSKAELERFIKERMEQRDWLQVKSRRENSSYAVARDLWLNRSTNISKGDDESGYVISGQTPEGNPFEYFAVKEGPSYHLLEVGYGASGGAIYALYVLDQHEGKVAKRILDNLRDLNPRGGGDDPLSGPTLPRFWTVDRSHINADPESMRIAAISILDGSMDIKPYLNFVSGAREKASGDHRTDFDLLLAYGYLSSDQPERAMPYIDALLAKYPDSFTAVRLRYEVCLHSGNLHPCDSFLDAHLAQKPDDPDLLRLKASLRAAENDYAGARLTSKEIFDGGRAEANDYNLCAWWGLFDGSLGPDITDAAQRANTMTNDQWGGLLQTLAAIYAAQGKTVEARQVLEKVMEAENLPRPDSSIWIVLGLIDEDYGLKDAALDAYRKVDTDSPPGSSFIEPNSDYTLAQRRIAVLTGKHDVAKSNTTEARNRLQ